MGESYQASQWHFPHKTILSSQTVPKDSPSKFQVLISLWLHFMLLVGRGIETFLLGNSNESHGLQFTHPQETHSGSTSPWCPIIFQVSSFAGKGEAALGLAMRLGGVRCPGLRVCKVVQMLLIDTM